jgi:hypothetical protein
MFVQRTSYSTRTLAAKLLIKGPGVVELRKIVDLLDDIQECRIINGLLTKDSTINSNGATVWLKCQRSWMAEAERVALDIRKSTSQSTSSVDGTIQVNYTVVAPRSDEEIAALTATEDPNA